MTTSMVDKLTISEIREFRANRIKEIKNGETPKPLDNNNELFKIGSKKDRFIASQMSRHCYY